MKQLFFVLIVLSTIACQKQEVDCDNYRAKCTYIQFSYTYCPPSSNESGDETFVLYSDTLVTEVWGCPDELNLEFIQDQERTMNAPTTPENVKKFMKQYPSTCNCE
jgi:hypothetical protein